MKNKLLGSAFKILVSIGVVDVFNKVKKELKAKKNAKLANAAILEMYMDKTGDYSLTELKKEL